MMMIGTSMQALASTHAKTTSLKLGLSLCQERWRSAYERVLRVPSDPWSDMPPLVPTELAVRRSWDQDLGAWKAEAVLVKLERDVVFAQGAMRECRRLKVLQSARKGWRGAG